ncbi:MAG: hypothetical protein JKY12_08650 [Sneathiella sp.]|nr:hypothetical protein [Sneathiella sp.]
MKILKFWSSVLGVTFFLLFAGGLVFLDYTLDHAFSYRFGAIFRPLISPEYYDDTYQKTAQWPLPDSKPFKATVKFEYKSRSYSVDRVVRCYRDVGKMNVHGTGFIWYSHLKLFVVPLHDGGIFIADIPGKFCDTYSGVSQSQPIKRLANGFTYLDNEKSPTYLETYFFRADTTYNVAVSGKKHPIDPKKVYVSAEWYNKADIDYSSNKQSQVYSSYHNPSAAILSHKANKNTLYLTGLRTTVLFKAQWAKNAHLVEFLSDKTEPTLVPKGLLPGRHGKRDPSKELEQQVNTFFQKRGYSIEALDPGKYFYVFMRLTELHEWQVDYSQIGGFRYFRRACDAEFKNCRFQENIRQFLKTDFVKIRGLTENVTNISGIYLPQEQIILSYPIHKTIYLDAPSEK